MKKKIPLIVRIILVLGAITLISFLFPNNSAFPYKYHAGQSWPYTDLYAPFNFAINKSKDEIATSRERIEREFIPYYQKIDVLSQRLQAFDQQMDQLSARPGSAEGIPANEMDKYRQLGEQIIRSILGEGVVEVADEHQDRGEKFLINILEGNVIRPVTLQSLKTREEAKSVLEGRLATSRLEMADTLVSVIDPLLVPNIIPDRQTTTSRLQNSLDKITPTKGLVEKGDLIILKNGIVTDSIYQILSSYQGEYEKAIAGKERFWGIFAGYFLLTFILVGIFIFYLRATAVNVYTSFRRMLFTLMWIVLFSYLVYIVHTSDDLNIYLIPFCIVPIVFKNFFSQRIAFFTHLIIVLIAAFLANAGMHFIFLNLMAGMVALLTLRDTKEWGPFFKSLLFIFLSYTIGWISLQLISKGGFQTIDYKHLVWFFISAFLTLLAYPIIPLFGRLFGFVSAISLAELSDFNRPLLKKLSLEAPGTFQHSLQVANLAESAAEKINANSLLVKVGALYHDIGKLTSPGLFVENQVSHNPHDTINDNIESATKIIAHVTDGVKRAEKARMPYEIIQFIRTHHGTTRVEYFYRKQVKENPDADVDASLFRYPGPRPKSREQCILMLADSIEATAKSLKEHTAESLDNLVDNIIQSKLDQDQFRDSNLSFHDLERCREVFKNSLRSIYHPRIEYPEGKSPASGFEGNKQEETMHANPEGGE